MKVPLSWLNEYISLPAVDVVCHALTKAGIEVEHIEHKTPIFTGVVVGKVIETKPHPKADRLQIASVWDGTTTLQIVCGDPHCRPGLTVALAKIDAVLPLANGSSLTIQETMIRSVPSFGMLCSLEELGLAEISAHIVELPESFEAGKTLSSLLQETVLDLSFTPNLGHAMSIYGLARELSSFLSTPLRPLVSSVREGTACITAEHMQVQIHAQDLCLLYQGRLVTDLRVEPSPFWLARRLELCGMRSINNLVDISNYVLLLTGQPLHFFDASQIEGKTLHVGQCDTSMTFETLDGIMRTVPSGSLLISDTKRPLAIGGVLGAKAGSVQETTHMIFIEAALFSRSTVRKVAKSIHCKTDASMHFERGIDPLMLPIALDIAADLLRTTAHGIVAQGVICHDYRRSTSHTLFCSQEETNRLLGTHLSLGEMRSLFEELHMETTTHEQGLLVSVPSYRNDILEEVDLIEEIIRLYGFENLPERHECYHSSILSDAKAFTDEQHYRMRLLREGLQEFLTCDLLSPDLSAREDHSSIERLQVLHAKSSDYSCLRTSLLPGLLQVVKHNIDRGELHLAGFEIGRVHYKEQEIYREPTRIGILLTGLKSPYHHSPKTKEVDFFDLKGIVENLLHTIPDVRFCETERPLFQPGRQAHIEYQGDLLGVLGEVHPFLRAHFDIEQRVFFAELDLATLARHASLHPTIHASSEFPGSERDWTITVCLNHPVGSILDAIHQEASSLLEKVYILDSFTSDTLGHNRQNLTFRFCYRDSTKTLDSFIVERTHTELIQKVAKKLEDCLL